ncbi:DUF1501 domain-containing protein [Asticcacaulis sp. AC402]|uniref:DUF1501 domain-containing protein n=1 Tax=Asticcacaulis sp. AC402 TaxID=1282361 RepID=UPI0003C3F062|nr:DUF1501 domain-containing protein [Asticcacaulis sp. AC402]ESQ74548.1 Tat pathway signal protein [Asticcacaulis sp. AC402]
MYKNNIPDLNRRAFLQRSLALSAMGVAAPMALNLAAAGEAAAFDATDYKAIVCLFMFGGNDYANTVVPYDLPNYDRYASLRGGSPGRLRGNIAYGHAELTPTALTPVVAQTLTDNMQFALNPNLPGLASLFHAGKAAIQLNIGPLVVPTTKAQFLSNGVPLPPKLFSHNDQQSVWQALGSEGATRGWGGRIGDLALSSNTNSLLTCISAAGNAVFVSGQDTLQYQISPDGAIPIWPAKGWAFGSGQVSSTLRNLITRPSSHVLENEFARVTARSMAMEEIVNNALAPVTLATSFDTDGRPNYLANQLRVVARLIGARNTLGSKRQVFFVSIGGFDNHDGLMENHPGLMSAVNEAVSAFYAATVELGVADKVTLFTASDFGRTLSSNGNGSDHGWGSHHFVVGGAVRGGRFYGTAPQISVDTDDQVGQGRLLPTASVDQMGATLARWFGVSESELPVILPRIGNFATSNLGFMT